MGIPKGAEANYRTLNQSFISATGGGSMSGNYELEGSLTVGTAVIIRGHNDATLGSDIYFEDHGYMSAEDDMIFVIDSDADSSNAAFIWKKDTDTHPGGTDLMELKEPGRLHIYYTGDADLSNDGGLTIGTIASYNMTLDNDDIQGRNNGSASDIYLQRDGGSVQIGVSAITLGADGTGVFDSTLTVSGDFFGVNDALIQAIVAINTAGSGNYCQVQVDGLNTLNNTYGQLWIEGSHIDGSSTISIGIGGANAAGGQGAQNVNMGGTLAITAAGGTLQHNQSSPSGSVILGYNGYFYATRVYNAIYNDLAEFMLSNGNFAEPGDVMVNEFGMLRRSRKRAEVAVVGVYSDNYGFALGADKQEEKIPIGLAGKVKVAVSKKVKSGDELVSYRDGAAVKANLFERTLKRGAIIGKALEAGENKKVWMLIK